MKAKDIREGLEQRYSPAEYIHIHEAPEDASRLGRKLDVLVLSTWASRGMDIDGFEIKVSRSDWQRELAQKEKADWWWSRVNRFWLCVPHPHDKIVKAGELPESWGLLEFSEGGESKVIHRPTRREAAAIPWDTVVGCFRAIQGTGLNVISKARSGGYNDGYEAGVRDTKSDAKKEPDERLRAAVAAFEKASGLSITDQWSQPEAMGKAVARLMSWESPERTIQRLRTQVNTIEQTAKQFATIADDLEPLLVAKPSQESAA